MSTEAAEMFEAGMTVLALIDRAREEGLDREQHDRLMEPGLTDRQADVVDNYVGEGRVQLARDDTDIPTLFDKLAAQKKLPWLFRLDDEWFVVKTECGEGSRPHSRWCWREDGYKFTFYKPERDDCVPNIEIREV